MSEGLEVRVISDEELDAISRRIRPVYSVNNILMYLDRLPVPSTVKIRDWVFNDSSLRTQPAVGLKPFRTLITYHRPSAQGSFRPTYGEVIQAIDPEDLPSVVAFRTVANPEENNDEAGLLAGTTILYARA